VGELSIPRCTSEALILTAMTWTSDRDAREGPVRSGSVESQPTAVSSRSVAPLKLTRSERTVWAMLSVVCQTLAALLGS
jgi:hypothetical protein